MCILLNILWNTDNNNNINLGKVKVSDLPSYLKELEQAFLQDERYIDKYGIGLSVVAELYPDGSFNVKIVSCDLKDSYYLFEGICEFNHD